MIALTNARAASPRIPAMCQVHACETPKDTPKLALNQANQSELLTINLKSAPFAPVLDVTQTLTVGIT